MQEDNKRNAAGRRSALAIAAGLAMAAIGLHAPAASAAYPDKPIKFLVTFAAGGPADIAARTIAKHMTASMGQPVVVDNRAGASGTIGTELVARSAPDGYTIAIISGSHSSSPSLYSKLRYDPIADFAPVSQIVMLPFVLKVHPSVNAKSVKELIELAKREQLTYGSAGIGSTNHIAGEVFNSMAGVKTVHVPYKGTAPAFTDLVAGRLTFLFSPIDLTLPHIRSGTVRALAVASPTRSSLLPDLPTIAESGLPGYDIGSWVGALAPAKTPKDVVARLSQEIRKALEIPEVKSNFIKSGAEPIGSSPEAFTKYIREDIVKWTRIFKDAGIKPLD